MTGRTVTVAGLKGGVGKTTTATNLAAELAGAGERVLLVDLDPQGSAALSLGHVPVGDPLGGDPVPVPLPDATGSLMVLPGGRALTHASAFEVRRHIERARLAAGTGVLMIDTPPSASPSLLAAMAAADVVVAPVEATALSLAGLRDLVDLLGALDESPVLRILLVRVQARRIITGDVRDQIAAEMPGSLLTAEIPEDVRCAEAPGYGEPLLTYAPECRARLAYRAAAGQLRVGR